MRYNRKWGAPMELASEVGPRSVESTFAARWWMWWDLLQAESQKAGESPDAQWAEVGKMTGRNGVLFGKKVAQAKAVKEATGQAPKTRKRKTASNDKENAPLRKRARTRR
ncbi:hypothetical protein C8R47DRAFT_1215641 [Mycena vitilis]|nr:hypothetical protein C8R47DRAFT_1215641 [Mycena vitilis]